MAADLMEVLGDEADEMRDDVEGVDLELQELRRRPSGDDGVAVSRLWVEVEEKRAQEAFLHHDAVGLDVPLVVADRENLSPEELLELQVLVRPNHPPPLLHAPLKIRHTSLPKSGYILC